MTEANYNSFPGAGAQMPGKLDLVCETLDSFATDKSRSSVLQYDRPTLEALGLLLVDQKNPDKAGLQLLRDEYGDDVEVSRSAFYRFASEFRDRFDVIQRRYRQRIKKLTIHDATDGDTDQAASLITDRLVDLMAEHVVDAEDLSQVGVREIGKIITMLDGLTRAKFKRAELELKVEEADRRAVKLEAELELKRQLLQKLPEQVKRLSERVDDLATRTKRGDTIPQEVFASIRAELMGLVPGDNESEVAV